MKADDDTPLRWMPDASQEVTFIHKCACGRVAAFHGADGTNYCEACMDVFLNDERYRTWLKFYNRAKQERKL
jgi:hypothetical protein